MEDSSVRPSDDVEKVIIRYSDMIFRLCLTMLRSEQDAKDALQDTIYRYITKAPDFHEEEHRKAWLITVAQNQCKNMLRYRLLHTHVNIDDLNDYLTTEKEQNAFEILDALPPKYRIVMYLFYVEEYHLKEIASILKISENAANKRLQRGRTYLKSLSKGEITDGT